jgi:pimeloyl-ACP methyl ester carboxylesterase
MMRRWLYAAVAMIVVVGLAAGGIPMIFNWYLGETLNLDDAVRASSPGSFIKLSDGYTHYELSGPGDGQVVVLINGFMVPYYNWDKTVPALTEAGLRVLRYDLYGRGLSDRPNRVYDTNLFDRQLSELLDGLELRTPVDLAGVSMGGPLAAAFADRHPDRVRRLVFLDPAGFLVEQNRLLKLVQTPFLGELLMNLFSEQFTAGQLPGDFYHPERFSEYVERFRPAMRYRGSRAALLSTLRTELVGDFTPVYRRVAGLGKPILVIWGEEDTVDPGSATQRARQILTAADFHIIPEAGHEVHYERPELVNPLLVEFLTRQ